MKKRKIKRKNKKITFYARILDRPSGYAIMQVAHLPDVEGVPERVRQHRARFALFHRGSISSKQFFQRVRIRKKWSASGEQPGAFLNEKPFLERVNVV